MLAAVSVKVDRAAKMAGINKRVKCLTFRHYLTTVLPHQDSYLRNMQEVLEHRSIETTQIYTDVVG